MVISDGMPDVYKDIFEEYNGRADMRVRMFMYQIGDEGPGTHEMQWIARSNNGEKFVALLREEICIPTCTNFRPFYN